MKLSDRVQVEWLEPVPLAEAEVGDFVVSQPGSIAAAIVTVPEVRPFIVASICAAYEKPHRSTGKMSWNIVDASVHRIISDLSLLIGETGGASHRCRGRPHRLVRLRRQRILETTQCDGVRPDGGYRASLSRAAVSEWAAGRSVAELVASGQPARSHIPQHRRVPRRGERTA